MNEFTIIKCGLQMFFTLTSQRRRRRSHICNILFTACASASGFALIQPAPTIILIKNISLHNQHIYHTHTLTAAAATAKVSLLYNLRKKWMQLLFFFYYYYYTRTINKIIFSKCTLLCACAANKECLSNRIIIYVSLFFVLQSVVLVGKNEMIFCFIQILWNV